MIWGPSKNGSFSIRSAYYLAVEIKKISSEMATSDVWADNLSFVQKCRKEDDFYNIWVELVQATEKGTGRNGLWFEEAVAQEKQIGV